MMRKYWSVILVIGLGLMVALLGFLSHPVLGEPLAHVAESWYVTSGGDDNESCQTPASACATIDGALNKPGFMSGDTILVANGIYTGSGDEVVLLDKNAALSGGWDSSFITQSGNSTLDGEGVRRGITVNSGITASVDHFVVQNGYTDSGDGGGVHNSGILTVTNSTIKDNFAEFFGYDDHGGGGIYNIGTLTLFNSIVKNNTARDSGGGIYGTSGASAVIMDTLIYANRAFNNEGGGIQFDYDSHLSMSRSWVVGNAAQGNDVGGIGVKDGSAHIENSIIAGNSTPDTGGGLYFLEGGPYRIVNSHIVGNESNREGAAIIGTGVQVEITNTLIISNTGDTGIDDQWESSTVFLLSYCDTYGNSPDGTGGITITRTNCLGTPPEDGLNPMMAGGALPGGVGPDFADQWMSYDYRLQSGSPAIDAGTPAGAPATDIDGTPRDAKPDLGAYEHAHKIYLPFLARSD